MKKVYSLTFQLALCVIFIYLTSFKIRQDQDNPNYSQVGNVVYSVLKYEDFIKVNGPGWVYLDGEKYPDSELALFYNAGKLPDARGTFIRVLDNQDDPQKRRDIYRNFGETPGHYQGDRTRIPKNVKLQQDTHNHPISQIRRAFVAGNQRKTGEEYSTPGMVSENRFPSTDNDTHNHAILGGHKETAPKNIILYAYIKIN